MYRYKIKSLNDDKHYSEKILYNIFNSSIVPIVITKNIYPYSIQYINKSWHDLVGYSLEELYQQSIYYIRLGKINNIIINKKKNGVLFEHHFKIVDIISLGLKIGITTNVKIINLNKHHLLNKYISNELENK